MRYRWSPVMGERVSCGSGEWSGGVDVPAASFCTLVCAASPALTLSLHSHHPQWLFLAGAAPTPLVWEGAVERSPLRRHGPAALARGCSQRSQQQHQCTQHAHRQAAQPAQAQRRDSGAGRRPVQLRKRCEGVESLLTARGQRQSQEHSASAAAAPVVSAVTAEPVPSRLGAGDRPFRAHGWTRLPTPTLRAW